MGKEDLFDGIGLIDGNPGRAAAVEPPDPSGRCARWVASEVVERELSPAPGSFADATLKGAAVFWFLFLLTGVALFLLRKKDRTISRPFKVPAYPLLPLLFCGACGYMVVGSIIYNPWYSLAGLGIALMGLPFYFIPRWPTKAPAETEEQLPVG